MQADSAIGHVLKAVAEADMGSHVEVEANVAGELKGNPEIFGRKILVSQNRWANAAFKRQRKALAPQQQAGTDRADGGIVARLSQPTE